MLGPYRHGLGDRRKRTSSESSTGEETIQNVEDFFSKPEEETKPTKKRRVTHLDAEIIPKFDPGKKTTNVKGWLNKIDQLGDMYEWDQRDRIFIMQIRLRGAAREWYDDLEDYAATWTQWKEDLSRAFPRSTDYVDRLEEMLARNKGNEETMTKYFHDKMSLLKKCNLEGDAAISCLIRGLPAELRANAKAYSCQTPEELYYGFLSSLENYKKVNVDASETKSTWHRGSFMPKICFNCRKTGHEARDCRLTRCHVCQRLGHAATACWFAATTSGTGSGSREFQTSQPQRNIQQVRQVSCISYEIFTDNYMKRVTINDIAAIAYIDTGSKVNIIRSRTVEVLQLKIAHSNVLMRGFGGSQIVSLGRVQFHLHIDDVHLESYAEITEADLRNIDIIVGQPVINHSSVTLIANSKLVKLVASIDEQSLIHELSNIKLTNDDYLEKVPLLLANDLNLPPGATCDIFAQVTQDIGSDSVLITRPIVYSLGKESYFIPQSILTNKNLCLQVTNLGDSCLCWTAGRLLTRADFYEKTEVFKVSDERDCNTLRGNKIQNKLIDSAEVDIGDIEEHHSKQLLNLLNQYRESFAECSSELGCTSLIEMHISTTTDVPVFSKPYRLSYKETEIVEQKVDELISAGIVRESNSEYASPVILVRKKGGDYRLCIDYRALNARTIKDRFPLPHIDDQINRLSGKIYFTALDLAQSYYQVRVSNESIPKTSFITPTGQYEFIKMPFGLANAPAVFSRLIKRALSPLNNKLAIYLDDVMIPSVTIEEGIDLLEQVLKLLQEANLKLNLKKCSFLKTSVSYLGHELSAGSVRPGQDKINSVSQFRRPRNVHEVRQFVGLASYFRRYVQSFAEIARPLTYLTKKGVEWVWGSEEEEAFQRLKDILTERPVLGIYNPHAKTELHTDASKLGLGGILLQYQEDSTLKPIAYFSRVTTKEEQCYHSYELETLAVVESLKRFRIYLTGIPVKVITDCSALRSALTKKDLVPRIARWWLTIQDFDIEIEYRPGNRMRHVDALSRNPVDCNVQVLIIDETDWRITLQLQDEHTQSIIRQLNEKTNNPDIINNYEVIDGCLFRKTFHGNRFVIPKLSKWSLLQKYHDRVGHLGFDKCEKAIKTQFWFKGMTRFIRKYINACLQCAYAKGNYGKLEGELHPIEKPQIPMHTIHADHLGPFLKTRKGNMYILVVIDSFTKFVFARPVRGVGSLETVRNLKEIVSVFGNPCRLITDRGVAFTSRYFKEFVAEKQIKHILNAIASPRSNGQVERVNRSIINGLNTTTESECTWDEKLADVVWGLNNTPHAITGYAPFNLMFTHKNTLLPAYPTTSSSSDNNQDMTNQLEERRQNAKVRIDKYMTVMKSRYDKKHKSCKKYKVGELVLWKGGMSRDHATRVTKKLGSCYTGPYKISKADHSIDRYTIDSIKGIKGYRKFSAVVPGEALRPYKPSVSDSSSGSDRDVDRDDLIDLLES